MTFILTFILKVYIQNVSFPFVRLDFFETNYFGMHIVKEPVWNRWKFVLKFFIAPAAAEHELTDQLQLLRRPSTEFKIF